MDSHVVQVTNVAPTASFEQVYKLFSFLGPIDEFQLYPKIPDPNNAGTKVAFVKFTDGGSVGVAQHLTNTVFIDRPLICVPYNEGVVPDESFAMQFVEPANAGPNAGLPLGSMDPAKLDEIRRTIYVGNLDSKSTTADQLMTFFSSCGEVKFVRMAGDETQPTRFAFVEFADVDTVQKAMQMNGALFGDRPLKINHSNNAIVKPPEKATSDTNSHEIDEAMRRVREAQTLIQQALEPSSKRKRSRSRSRSRDRHRRRRSRSRDRSRRRRSRSRSHGRSRRSRSRDRSRRSGRSRSRSRERRRKRSRSRSRRSLSRSPSKKSSKSHRKDRKKDHKRRSREKEKGDKSENKTETKENGSKGETEAA